MKANIDIKITYDDLSEQCKQKIKKLEKELDCKFIRATDKESDEYNIGLVFKELFNITVVS